MNKRPELKHQEHVYPPCGILPTKIAGFEQLASLALDLHWSWNHASDSLWRKLAPELWELTRNPWAVLQTVAHERIETLLAEPEYRREVDRLLEKQQALKSPAWFQEQYPKSVLSCIAYFSMEFMLSEALPIYSGGLGNVAGDQLKAASDLGIPVVGVGLLYQQGYFRQVISNDGSQHALYPYNDPGQLPITPVRQTSGDWLRLKVTLSTHTVWLRTWQVQVGRVKLYLLDSNDPTNMPAHRGITSELYGGDSEVRLQQELLLGMGGWRLLEELGAHPDVCHLNEGHAAFAVLERAYSFMKKTQQSFEIALAATRAGNVFTTHTAVSAGFDRFAPALIEQYLGVYTKNKLGISFQDLLALGRANPQDQTEAFNMAFLAIRGSGAINGVSNLHGKVSRHLFEPLFPRWPHKEVPIGHITNGVHMPTWDSAAADTLWTEACSKERWRDTTLPLKRHMCCLSDARIWQFRAARSQLLIDYTRTRLSRQLAASGSMPEELAQLKTLLNPDILTLGFARRFAAYKRNNLLLQDPARLSRILTNPDCPVQLIIAGKAHPQDLQGQALICQWIQFTQQADVRSHVVFLSDYDMHLGEQLVQGVDVWINTPRRPWEACGTSGMKVLVNGGINISELDGWWAEAYSPELGWALGDGQEHGDDPAWDIVEANALYTLLEQEVVPEFYQRNEQGIPLQWVKRMRESMAQLTPRFSVNRAIVEYTEKLYMPAAAAFQARSLHKGALAQRMEEWQQELKSHWGSMSFGEVHIETHNNQHHFEVPIYLNGMNPDAVRVELYADTLKDSAEPLAVNIYAMHSLATTSKPSVSKSSTAKINDAIIYRGSVEASRPAGDFTPRVVAYFDGISIPLEAAYIHWQS